MAISQSISVQETWQLITLFNSGHYASLERSVQSILERDPECGFAWQISGAALEKQGQNGLHALKKAAHILSDDPVAQSNFGNALRDHEQLDEAAESYEKAIELKPDFHIAHNGLGLTLRKQGKIDDAISSYQHAVLLKPDFAEAYNNLGNALQSIIELGKAAENYRRALAIKPDFSEIHANLGCVLEDMGHRAEAAESFRLAGQFNTESPKTHTYSGNLLAAAGQQHEAMLSFRRALTLDPGYAVAYNNMANSYQSLGRFDEANLNYRRALQINPALDAAFSSLLFALGHNNGIGPETLFAEHCGFGERFEAPWRANWPQHGNSREPERRLQIGFVSGDLRNHAVALFMEPIFIELAKNDSISIHIYHNQVDEDEITKRLRILFPQWNTVNGIKDDALVQKIRADNIDILIDLSGHTGWNRLLAFARKPAPLQVSWIGYPATTGMKAMDYYLADRFFLPAEQFADQFTEKIVHLPVNAAFLPYEKAPEINPLPMLTNGFITFGSFNRLSKISHSVVAMWAQLLRALPDSRLLFGAINKDASQDLFNWFEQEGIARDRIDIHPRSDLEIYLKLHHEVDLCLDTFPYTGGTTTWHALWMGVPTLTLAGSTPSGRQGAAILGQVGLDDFIAHDEQDFVQKGLAWAKQAESLAEIRAQMRERFAQSLAGRPSVVAHGLEQALRTMWRRWCAGQPPAHFACTE